MTNQPKPSLAEAIVQSLNKLLADDGHEIRLIHDDVKTIEQVLASRRLVEVDPMDAGLLMLVAVEIDHHRQLGKTSNEEEAMQRHGRLANLLESFVDVLVAAAEGGGDDTK